MISEEQSELERRITSELAPLLGSIYGLAMITQTQFGEEFLQDYGVRIKPEIRTGMEIIRPQGKASLHIEWKGEGCLSLVIAPFLALAQAFDGMTALVRSPYQGSVTSGVLSGVVAGHFTATSHVKKYNVTIECPGHVPPLPTHAQITALVESFRQVYQALDTDYRECVELKKAYAGLELQTKIASYRSSRKLE